MKSSLQDQADDVTLWEALKCKFEKSSTYNTSCREDEFHSYHDEHHDDDAPPEGEKRVKRSKESKRSKSAREENVVDKDEVIPENITPKLIAKFQNVDKRVPTIFDHERMETSLRGLLSDQFRNAEEYAYQIPEVVRAVTDQLYGLDFMEQILVMRANDKPYSFSEADFKSRMIWEMVHDFQLGIESYRIRVNLTAPILTFPGIEEYTPYLIVGKPQTGLIYLNSKEEKRVMYLVEIVKFCDATLEKVLNEVKLIMFDS
ncbi:hypothetical protein Tco_1211282 [Tanacetum coccineum]